MFYRLNDFVHGQFEFEHENIYFNLSEGIIGF